ncbi:MgtC/SapB family protein [Luteimonas sp. e5]
MDMVHEVIEVLAEEFSLPDADSLTRVLVRLLSAMVLGGLIGWERERGGHPAGFRTHMLVAMGSALFVMAPLLMGVDGAPVTRVMQGIVQGIGFLGAGAILKSRHGERVHGLTTAAGIWLAAAIGMSAGLGQNLLALISTVLALMVLALLPRWAPEPEKEQ